MTPLVDDKVAKDGLVNLKDFRIRVGSGLLCVTSERKELKKAPITSGKTTPKT